MAIYHFSGEVVGRKSDPTASCVAASAYRSGSKVGEHDFTRKEDAVWSAMLFCDGCPEELRSREALWSAVDAVEKRKDAQLFRSFDFAFPNCFSYQDCKEVICRFAGQQWVSQGMCADISIHDKVVDGQQNLHGHAMLTLRVIDENGIGKKNRAWNEHELMERYRVEWQRIVNERLRELGKTERIDHRSYKAQGLGLKPTKHLGRYRTAQERKGHVTSLGDYNRRVEAQNAHTRRDLTYRIKYTRSKQEIDAEDFRRVLDAPMSLSLQKQIDTACGTDFAKGEMIRRHNAWVARSQDKGAEKDR